MKNPRCLRSSVVSAALATLRIACLVFAGLAPEVVAAESELILRRETETALAALRPAVDAAESRWRADFAGKFFNRSGQPIPESELLAEVRRAVQAVGGASPRIEALWLELQEQRIDPRGFGDQLDSLFEQAVVTSWDMHLGEARRSLALLQKNLDTESARLRHGWMQTVAGISRREGLSGPQRQQAIAAASAPVQEAERALLSQAEQQLDAAAQRLARARQTLRDLVAARADAAKAAGRPGAPQRLTALIATQFESAGTDLSDGGSSLDGFLSSARLTVPAIVLRTQPRSLDLGERIRPLFASRLAAENENRLQGPRPPPPPRIAYVTVLERGTDPATGAATRVLGVLGQRLIEHGTPAVSGEPDRAYEIIATRGGVLAVRPDEPHATAWSALAAQAGEGLLPSEATMARLLDAVLVRVRLPHGLLPGLETMLIAGAEHVWPLDAPTTQGTLSYVRVMPWGMRDEVDRPLELFLQSEFAVQVDTNHPIRADRLHIALVGPAGRLTIEDASGAKFDSVPALRRPEFPHVVRTPPIFLLPAGLSVPPAQRERGTYYVAARHADTLLATIVGRPFDDGHAATTVDAATVLLTPGNIATVDGKSMLFFEAMFDAARIHDVDIPRGTDQASSPVVDSITHTFLAQFRQHEIEFTLADHAALLALKRTFIAMAARLAASHREVLSSETRIAAYVPEMTRIMGQGARLASDTGHTRNFPLGYHERIRIVTDQDLSAWARHEYGLGGHVPLFHAFSDTAPTRIYEGAGQTAIFRHAATRRALEVQIAGLEKAIAYARDCDDDQVEELLELVGANFDAVIAEVMPRLVRSEPDPVTGRSRWVPDRVARQAVRQLAATLEEHRTAEHGAKADTEAVLALLTATGLGLAEGVAAKVVLAVASAASVGVAGLDVANLHLSRAEADFAAHAVEIIGEDRLVLNRARLDLDGTPYLTFALSVVGLKLDVGDVAKAVQLSTARAATEHALGEIAQHGFTRLARLTPKDRVMVSALMDEAVSLRAAGKPLSPQQQAAAHAADGIERQFAGNHPWNGGAFPPKISLHPLSDDPRLVGTLAEVDPRVAITEIEPRTSPSVVIRPELPGSAAPAPQRTPRYMPVSEIPAGMPLPGFELSDPITHVKYRVGQPYGAGAYATTYELLDASGQRSGRVVKFLRQPWEETGVWKKRWEEATFREMGTHGPWDPSSLPEVIDRMLDGQRLLKDAEIPHLNMATIDEGLAAAGRDAEVPFVIQDVIPDDAVLIPRSAATKLEPAQQAAVARLYKRLADADIVWFDGHLQNIYLKPLDGGGWEAGILDPDMLMKFDQAVGSAFYRNRLREIFEIPAKANINSMRFRDLGETVGPDVLQRAAASSHEFMARMLEFRGLLKFGRLAGEKLGTKARYLDGQLDADIVVSEFGNLDRFIEK